MPEKKQLEQSKLLTIVIVVSLLVGGASGSVAGFLVGSAQTSTSAWQWLAGEGDHRDLLGSMAPADEVSRLQIIQQESSTINAVQSVTPSVVSIVVTKEFEQLDDEFFSPFDDFFGFPFDLDIPDFDLGPQEIGGGTGFVVDADEGFILTNRHVVDDEDAQYTVVTNKGKEYEASVVARDPFNDLAVIQVQSLTLPELSFADSDTLKLGQSVIAIGNSLGEFSNTVTTGVVSGIGRDIIAGGVGQSERLDNVIQTDAAINPGNSGGPLIDLAGKVVGVNTAVSRQGQLIGFAIPSKEAKKVVESVERYGRIVRPYIGVRYILLNERVAKEEGLNVVEGALIVPGDAPSELGVIPESPAEIAGLVVGDVITKVDGVFVTEETTLANLIQQYTPGDTVILTIISSGTERDVQLTLDEYVE
ncbi:MAG: S1C family serine protease [Patescibacteria group bacterium]